MKVLLPILKPMIRRDLANQHAKFKGYCELQNQSPGAPPSPCQVRDSFMSRPRPSAYDCQPASPLLARCPVLAVPHAEPFPQRVAALDGSTMSDAASRRGSGTGWLREPIGHRVAPRAHPHAERAGARSLSRADR